MEILVTYDVATDTREGQKRLGRVAKMCEAHGQRVQKSVFECNIDAMQLEQFLFGLKKVINEEEDSLRIYRLREPYDKHVQELGKKLPFTMRDPLIL